MRVKLRDINPNPFRRIDEYPLDPTRVEALKNSIDSTGWWQTVVARERDGGGVELAFGHHRLEALHQLYAPDHEVDLTVQPLDDDKMLRMMADENLAEWAHDASIETATVKAVLTAAEEGQITLPEVPDKAPKSRIRKMSRAGAEDIPYTAQTIADYLGANWSEERVGRCLSVFEELGDEATTIFSGTGITPDMADEIARTAKRTAKATNGTGKKKTDRQKKLVEAARELADGVRAGTLKRADLRKMRDASKPKVAKPAINVHESALKVAVKLGGLLDNDSYITPHIESMFGSADQLKSEDFKEIDSEFSALIHRAEAWRTRFYEKGQKVAPGEREDVIDVLESEPAPSDPAHPELTTAA